MIRAVYDTNIVVSGTLTPNDSPTARILDAAIEGRVRLISSEWLIDEYRDVMTRAKFSARLAAIGKTAAELVSDYSRLVEIVEPASIAPVIVDDPDDDHVLACALAGNAEYIVSGDNHLVDLRQYKVVRICTAREFQNIIYPTAPLETELLQE